MNLRKLMGLDGAVAYTFLARATNIVGSTGTVLLIVHFLTPIEQGYYYTLLSLISLQVVFELGFSFVIQQLAAHECIHLERHLDGSVTGDPVAHARLASTLQLTLRWYTLAAVVLGLVLAPLGTIFFARHAAAGASQVAWQGPWLLAVVVLMAYLWCTPFYSFMEGCGQVRAVAAMRFCQAGAAITFAWATMLLHHGLYAPALVAVGQTGVGLVFLVRHRRFLLGLLRYPAREDAIHWTREIWPFQWRIAVSTTCSYFTVQILIPILFALRGAVEAGQMGMSLSITGYIATLALAWTSTKTTPFGRMVARREFQGLDRIFLRTVRQSMAVFCIIALGAIGVAVWLPEIAPSLAARMVSAPLFTILMLAAGANFIVQTMAILLRSFKNEPFLVQSLFTAILTLALGALTSSRWGNAGVAFSCLAASAVFGLPFAWTIFVRARRGYLSTAVGVVFEGGGVSELPAQRKIASGKTFMSETSFKTRFGTGDLAQKTRRTENI